MTTQFVGTTTYSYGNDNQLSGEARQFDYTSDVVFAYDVNGNRVQVSGENETYNYSWTTNYANGQMNRITSDGWFTYTHDNEGNITSKGNNNTKYEYEWDHRNRLSAVKLYINWGSGLALYWTMTYGYDAFNQLVRRSIDGDGPGGYAPIDGFYSHEKGQIVLEFGQYSYGQLTQRFVWGPQIDQLLINELNSALYGSGELYYTLGDHQQTIHDAAKYISSAGATKVVTHRYGDAWGTGGSYSNFEGVSFDGSPFAYTGRYLDIMTGLQWNLNRWYDPNLGRWISEDPIGFAGDPYNLYRYVANSPTNYTDPSGTHIYLKQGNVSGNPVNDTFHWQVSADDWVCDETGNWKQVGVRIYSFGVKNPLHSKVFPAASKWLGWSFPRLPMPGLVGNIYPPEKDVGELLAWKKTTPEQDEAWIQYMDKRLFTEDIYTLLFFNCRLFSRKEFEDAPGSIQPLGSMP